MPHNSLLLVNKAAHSVFSGVALARLSDNQTVFVLQTVSQELKSCRHKARYDGWLLNILKSQLCLHVRNHSWITRCLNKRIQPFVNFSSRNFRYRSASPMWKKTQTNRPVSLKLLHCVLSGLKCTHMLQSLFPSSSTQEFGYQSSMSASIQWSCVTLNQTASKSIVWERAVRRYLGPLPLAQGLHLSSGLCYQSLPELHYRYGCAWLFPLLILWLLSELNLRLGLRPVLPLWLLLGNLVLCHSTSSGISESWSIMDSHMLQLLSSTQYILHSESRRAALTMSTRAHLC